MAEVSLPIENHGKNQDMIKRSPDGFVAVDIGALSSKTEHMENSSSRKGYQRNGEENTGKYRRFWVLRGQDFDRAVLASYRAQRPVESKENGAAFDGLREDDEEVTLVHVAQADGPS